MNEQSWLSSDDPALMLQHLTHETERRGSSVSIVPRVAPLVSDRKLRLFACACCRLAGTKAEVVDERELNGAPDTVDGDSRSDAMWASEWTESWIGESFRVTLPVRAALLREIVGNPFRPVTLAHDGWRDPRNKVIADWKLEQKTVLWMSHVTPTVLALAQAAYEKWQNGECVYCCGRGENESGLLGRQWAKCIACDGTGTGQTADGTLDPDRLLVLADALEDAGCQDETILRHCRGEERCWERWVQRGNFAVRRPHPTECECDGSEWRKQRSPHVRGCWCLDLILGRE